MSDKDRKHIGESENDVRESNPADMSEENADEKSASTSDRSDTEIKVEIKDSAESSDEKRVAESDESSRPENGTSEEEAAEAESERYLRLAAEFDNYRKRTTREFGEVVRTANARLLRSLIEIVDNFERALGHEVNGNDGEAYRKGIELIYNQLVDLLNRENVKPIESIGQPFDPNCHEALMQADSSEYDEGIVSQEIQKGYKIDDKVLRHARVVVSKGRAQDDEEK